MLQDQLDELKTLLQGRYRIDGEIGHGGMSVVYRARDLRHDRDVAVKVLRPELTKALGAKRFLREIKTAARLQHPYVLPLHDSGEAGGILYCVMPYVEGETVKDRLAREGPLPLDEALEITRDIASALAYAHDQGVLHRDVKPGNILLSSGHAVLADFGIARAISEAGGTRLTETGIVIGTPEYMSPEQARGDRKIDGRSDLYSLGCVLFEMLAGEPPFTGPSRQVVMARHVQERLPSLEIVRPNIPPRIASAVERTLAKSAANRFATGEELIASLESAEVEARLAPVRSRGAPWRRGIALGGILVVAALVTWLALGPDSPSLDTNKVVVFPLVERGVPPSKAGAGHDVALMIEAALEHAAPLKWIDGWGRLSPDQRSNIDLVTPDHARNIARDRNSRFYINGAVQSRGDSTTVLLRLQDAAADSMIAQASASGSNATPLHHLGIDAVTRLLPQLLDPNRAIDLAPLRDRNTAAIALWIQGEREYRRSQFLQALDFYERAVREDSALAFAAIKGAQAASWLERPEAEPLAMVAVSRDSLLPTKYTQLAHGLRAYLTGQADLAVARFERALETAPDWAEAHMALGEVFYHLLPSRNPLDSLAESSFTAAVQADSGFAPPLYHLAEIALRRSKMETAQQLVDRYMDFEPGPQTVRYMDLMLQCVRNGPSEIDWTARATEEPLLILRVGQNFSVGGHNVACAESGFRAVIFNEDAPDNARWAALFGLQGLLVAQGRHAETTALLDSAVAAGTGVAMGAYILDAIATDRFHDKAANVDRFLRSAAGDQYEGLSPPTLWLVGVWHAYLRDLERLAAIRRTLVSSISEVTGDGGLFARALAAHRSLGRGDTTHALSQFRALVPEAPRDVLTSRFGASLPVERLRTAQLLLASGEPEQALAVAKGFDHPQPLAFLPFLPASLRLREKASIGMGRQDLADHYRGRLQGLNRGYSSNPVE